ncbi:MAG TPA: hypothetical protein VLS89_18945 [Candidatus Nanopelagicales bacterium]|nr:hypothetical protein [Candidatus Nanopelagicales bacterium]
MSDPQANPDPSTPDPEAALKAYNATLPRLETLSKDSYVTLSVDPRDASVIALSVSRFIADPAVRARFDLLHADVFDPQHLTDLPLFALALYHAHTLLQGARSGATEARLPVGLADEATEVKARMLDLCDYNFRRDARVSAEVAAIRRGTGYKDLASDLSRLAQIYQDHLALVSRDPVNYRDTDAADARRLAQAILKELGEAQSKEEKRLVGIVTGLWTLLHRCYGEVQSAGLFLFRHQDGDQKFPSLFTKTARRTRKPAGGEGGGEK